MIGNGLRGYVYMLTNRNGTVLYTGVTRDLRRRVAEHRLHINEGFTARYQTEKWCITSVFPANVNFRIPA